jgi:pyridoxine 5-phosphate synthase
MTPFSSHTALSVNLNKVALVRNTRHLGIPSVTRAASVCLEAGASGITVHPRPDARHIRADDVFALAELLKAWPDRDFNIEGNPFHNLMDFVRKVRPQQTTFVPDSEGQFTSDHGWNFPQDAKRLEPLIASAKSLGVRVSLFMDPCADAKTAQHVMQSVKAIGADRVELYTESYARAFGREQQANVLKSFTVTAQAAIAAGLGVNAGHDLNLDNLRPFVQAVPKVAEVSIGHALIGDALEMGYSDAVRAYKGCLQA